jgi:hypothetical protein
MYVNNKKTNSYAISTRACNLFLTIGCWKEFGETFWNNKVSWVVVTNDKKGTPQKRTPAGIWGRILSRKQTRVSL